MTTIEQISTDQIKNEPQELQVEPNQGDQEIPWNDPREKRNPHNWSFPKKLFHTAVPCLLAFQM